ncbi:MAG: vitamin B12-dependent ribonucleotide reductase [Deltaproteobacteria bacterium]|nr:vitamin B12-dependent ribonucleotide reductase [Deltaproteobacteria bacterium]
MNIDVQLTENAIRVLEKRYLKKDLNGNPVETPESMFRRVAKNISQAERLYDPEADIERTAAVFYELMTSLEFMPNSPTLMNAGRDLQQLSACFVLPVDDSMESIFEAVKHTAIIHKSGGGTGFSFSRLRPSGDVVGSTSGISSGPISFMTVFDSATEAIKQGGTRRGANMGILRIDHPDILHFITCKQDNNKLNNFNISVAITEDFMKAVMEGGEYELKNPRTGKDAGKLNAKEVFEKIVNMAWKNGDPGIIFIDRINRDNPTPHIGEIESTNPCGEQPLLPYESCNLGSINLAKMVRIRTSEVEKMGSSELPNFGTSKLQKFEIDWDKVGYVAKEAVHFLDNVIDMNRYPIQQIEKMTKGNRKIGLGVMGFADMLVRLDIPYDSDEAIKMAEDVMGFIHEKGREASQELAEKRVAFPNFKGSIYDGGAEVRNATVTTIATTGTISIISNCSSGIEPIFALAYTRNVLDGAELVEANPLFEEIARERGFYNPEILKQISKSGSLHDVAGVPDDIKRLFVTSHDIVPEWHLKMQAAFQKYTDNAVSKTVNFPNEAMPEHVADVYRLAYELDCKGVTVYRDGSREVQVLNKGQKKESESQRVSGKNDVKTGAGKIREVEIERPSALEGKTYKVKTPNSKHALYVTLTDIPDGNGGKRPFEIFLNTKDPSQIEWMMAITRLISAVFRRTENPSFLVEELKAIYSPSTGFFSSGRHKFIPSLVAEIGHVIDDHLGGLGLVEETPPIEAYFEDARAQEHNKGNKDSGMVFCLECSERTLIVQEGCRKCLSCGYTKC